MTPCILKELISVGAKAERAVLVAEQMYRQPCAHEGTFEPDECIKNLVGDKNREKFLVCTQDEGLKIFLRDNTPCPILFMAKGVLIMDAPSEVLRQRALI